MKVGRLLLRATVGGFFVGHGTQKLFGSFGGQGLKATAEGYEKMGIRPGNVQAIAAGVAETAGGAGVALGYRTPLASATLISVMATAINRVHLKNGPWASKGGYEYNAVLIAALATLAETGPGSLSLDALRGKERSGAKWSLLALAGGAAGAAAAQLLSESRGSAAVAPAEEPAPVEEPVAAAAEAEPVAEEQPVEAAPEGDEPVAEAEEAAGDEG